MLREHVADASVDLIYLDPPFNSNASYNILFKSPAGKGADASIEAFGDTWAWGPTAENALLEVTGSGNSTLIALLSAMEKFIGKNAMMAYLAMMAVRLVELHRVLKSTGSLYLHCDPTASHYLKLVLDAVFGPENYRNEISWRRTGSHNDASQGLSRYGRTHDVIFFYQRSKGATWHLQFSNYSDGYKLQHYSNRLPDGRRYKTSDLTAAKPGGDVSYEWKGVRPPTGRYWAYSRANLEKFEADGRLQYAPKSGMPRLRHYLDEMPGIALGDSWDDIPPINSQAQERLGYPTQKPRALLERIIAASSNPGDVVLDPFCGCGTAVDAAQKLGRQWIGIDVTHLAVGLIEDRMRRGYPEAAFQTIGVPADKASALRLAAEKPHEFQNWFCLRVGGYPLDGGRKGADKGVDGHFYFFADNGRAALPGVISVKAGANIGVAMIRDLRGVMEREKYDLALFLSAYEPTGPMKVEAASAGKFDCAFGRFDRIQIVTPADLFHAGPGASFRLPPLAAINRRAARVETRASHQPGAQGDLLGG